MKTRDANDIAHELRLCLRPDMDEKRVEHAVPANNRHVKNARLGFTWRRFRPNVVLIGVGALAGGHRLKYPSRIGELSKLSSTITRIVATAETWDNHFRSADGGPEYHCVGDVCNFLFPVPPPGGTLTDLPEELVEDISRFNDNIASVSISQLAEVRGNGSVLAIAGGLRYKGYAIRHVLRHRPGFVTHLVTDDQCARWLCGPVETGRDPRIEKARKAIRKRKPTRRGSRTV